jgi:hypothetical protein
LGTVTCAFAVSFAAASMAPPYLEPEVRNRLVLDGVTVETRTPSSHVRRSSYQLACQSPSLWPRTSSLPSGA